MRGQCVQNAVKRSEALERKKQDWLDCGQNRNKGIRHAWRDRPSTIRGQLLLWPLKKEIARKAIAHFLESSLVGLASSFCRAAS